MPWRVEDHALKVGRGDAVEKEEKEAVLPLSIGLYKTQRPVRESRCLLPGRRQPAPVGAEQLRRRGGGKLGTSEQLAATREPTESPPPLPAAPAAASAAD